MSTAPTPAAASLPYATPTTPKPTRLASLDIFRGLTIAGMLLVNNPGSWGQIYPPLAHAPWHGWTPTDLVFPFFLFIMGVAIPFSFAKRTATDSRKELFLHILSRGLALFVLGELLTGLPGLPPPAPATFPSLFYLRLLAYAFVFAGFFFVLYPWKSKRLSLLAPPITALAFLVMLFVFHVVNTSAVASGIVPQDYNFGSGILSPERIRIPGVLQRIGVCYVAAATLTLFRGVQIVFTAIFLLGALTFAVLCIMMFVSLLFGSTGAMAAAIIPATLLLLAACFVLIRYFAAQFSSTRAIVAGTLVFLAAYSVLMLAVPYPSLRNPNTTVRGLLEKDDNFARYVDVTLLGKHNYGAYPDPEGIVSTLPAIGTALLGVLAGLWLRRTDKPLGDRCSGLFAFGVLAVILGYILDSALMPINKQIWTPSYTVLCAGLSLLGLGTFFYLADVLMIRRPFLPLTWYGMNAITAFVLAGVVARFLGMIRWEDPDRPGRFITLGSKLAASLGQLGHLLPFGDPPKNASLAYALAFVLFFGLLMGLLYRLKIFLKV